MDTRALLEAAARAYMERERQRVGIPAQEQAAAESETATMLRRAQAARLMQEMGTAPADRDLRRRLTEAQIRNYDEPNRNPPAPPTAGSIGDYMGADPARRAEIVAARKAVGQADDRPRQPPISLSLPISVMDKKTGQMTYVTREEALREPGRYVPPPTTAERNVASGVSSGQMTRKLALQRGLPVLTDLGSRALSLNKGSEGGLGARIGGMGRSAASRMGLDPASDLYRTGVRGFTPLLARSAGHVGVLTELDVQRTEELFPRIGDAENVTAEKLARLKRIMTGEEPLPFEFEHPEYDAEGITQQPGAEGATPPTSGLTPEVERRLKALGL